MGVPQKKHSVGQTSNSKCKKCPAGTLFIWHGLYLGDFCVLYVRHALDHMDGRPYNSSEEYFRVVSRQTAGNGACWTATSMFNVVKFSKPNWPHNYCKLREVVFPTWSCCTLVTYIILHIMLCHFNRMFSQEWGWNIIILYPVNIIMYDTDLKWFYFNPIPDRACNKMGEQWELLLLYTLYKSVKK